MNKIQEDLVRLKLREIIKQATHDELELIFIESKRELDDRFFQNRIIGGSINVDDVRYWK